MNIEERLRDAFGQRAADVEVAPGALFEIQRRVDRTRRLPELRLRPALVLAAAACAAIAAVVSVSVTQTDPDPDGEIVIPPLATPSDPTEVDPPAGATPTTTVPQQSVDPVAPPPAGVEPAGQGSGQIATVSPPTPPSAAPSPTAPPTAAGDKSGTEPERESVTTAEEPACPAEPAGGEDADNDSTVLVTVYFACGASDAAPRQRVASANDLATALGVLLSGPNEADAAAGFRGLGGDTGRTAAPTPDDRWVTIDFPADLADAFGAAGGVTAAQFLTQLNATVFHFPEFAAAEYRLEGDCAAFGALLGAPCQVHTPDGDGYAGHTSELTAHTIGNVQSVIRAEPDDTAAEVALLTDGTRLTARRTAGSDSTWAEVITVAGVSGWVSVDTIVAQPLALSSNDTATMKSLAKQLTTGPNVESSAFTPRGLVLRWGADSDDVRVLPTPGAGTESEWWNRTHDIPSPRAGAATASPAELLWIEGSNDSAVVAINTAGPLGAPHADFAQLAYVSIYQAAVGRSTLPPELQPAPTTTTTAATTTIDDVELPPALPGLNESDDGDSAESEEAPEPLRAQISVIFDFLSPDGPRIAAVEAIWIEP